MQLSKETVEILKNYASINQGLVIKEGSQLRTISPSKALMAEATISESFDREFGIYDLHKFLGLLSMSKDNQIELGGEYVTISHPQGKVRQRYSPSNLILSPPDKSINVSNYDVEFDLPSDKLDWVFSVSSVLKTPNIVIRSVGSKIEIAAMDVKGEIVDDAATIVGATDIEFQTAIKVENLKILGGDYKVKLCSKVSKFENTSKKVHYFVAVEKDATKFFA
jgi:hypothetical protein